MPTKLSKEEALEYARCMFHIILDLDPSNELRIRRWASKQEPVIILKWWRNYEELRKEDKEAKEIDLLRKAFKIITTE